MEQNSIQSRLTASGQDEAEDVHKPNLLDRYGAELTAVVAPVCTCMMLVMWSVHVKKIGTHQLQQVGIANFYYQEEVRTRVKLSCMRR
jgi:hypothetical protein